MNYFGVILLLSVAVMLATTEGFARISARSLTPSRSKLSAVIASERSMSVGIVGATGINFGHLFIHSFVYLLAYRGCRRRNLGGYGAKRI